MVWEQLVRQESEAGETPMLQCIQGDVKPYPTHTNNSGEAHSQPHQVSLHPVILGKGWQYFLETPPEHGRQTNPFLQLETKAGHG